MFYFRFKVYNALFSHKNFANSFLGQDEMKLEKKNLSISFKAIEKELISTT